MGIEITFEHDGNFTGKPLSRSSLHVLVKDGCDTFFESNDPVSDAQRASVLTEQDKEKKRGYLLKMSVVLVDFLLSENNGVMMLHCPSCNKEYLLHREEYQSAYSAFLNNIQLQR